MRVKRIFLLLFCIAFFCTQTITAKESQPEKCVPVAKYPDYSTMYLGEDKFEGINRKIFLFNSGLNKYVLRPANILWASVMPLYGMDRIKGIYTNIQYPKRLVSTMLQKDFKASRDETLRFLANTTIGLGGMFDPAKSCFKINPSEEDLEQALCKCKVKQGPYIVVPGFTGGTTRDLASKVLECPLDPTLYVASPITVIAKASMILNKTTYMQPLSKMLESTFVDPYDITKKLYGLEKYIKTNNYDRTDLKESYDKITLTEENLNDELVKNVKEIDPSMSNLQTDNGFLLNISPKENEAILKADVELREYNPQCPLTDAMRTMLFNIENVNKSAWSEMSLWNRSFDKQVKNANISLFEDREKYPYRYILQKEKNSPIAILYPSFAENSNAHHNLMFAKILYDEGYSVIFQGNPFHWSFAKSMPQNYHPGLPKQDAEYLRLVSKKILDTLEKKYECKFGEKILIGTSMGAVDALFVGNLEQEDPQINFSKIIAVSPPVELVFALKQIDKFSDEWSKNIADVQHQAAQSASKVLQMKNLPTSDLMKDKMPFSEDEARLITCFYMRQKLSDLVFAIENVPVSKKTDFYQKFNNMNFRDYSEKYMLSSSQTSLEDLNYDTSLYSIADYLAAADNYKIYHSLDDYYVNTSQLQKLRELSKNKTVYLDRGSHLGFLYRDEFLNMLKNDISLKQHTRSTQQKTES